MNREMAFLLWDAGICLIVGVITNGLSILGADTAWQIVGKGLMIVLAVLLDSQTTALISKRLTKKQQQ